MGIHMVAGCQYVLDLWVITALTAIDVWGSHITFNLSEKTVRWPSFSRPRKNWRKQRLLDKAWDIIVILSRSWALWPKRFSWTLITNAEAEALIYLQLFECVSYRKQAEGRAAVCMWLWAEANRERTSFWTVPTGDAEQGNSLLPV